MVEISFFENETLDTCLRSGLDQVGASIDLADELESRLGEAGVARINAVLTELCITGLSRSTVEVRGSSSALGGKPLDWRIGRSLGPDGQPVEMRFIRVRDTGPKAAINLVALAIALAAMSPSVIPNLLQLANTLYESIVTLESPADDDAMTAYEALLQYATTTGWAMTPSGISAEDLVKHGGPAGATAIEALRRLKDVKLAEVVTWADRGGDYTNPANRWAHTA